MKLSEAYLEKSHLEKQIELLKQRIREDHLLGRGTAHTQEDLLRKANLLRDITIAIAWTEQSSSLSGLPLGAYKVRTESLKMLAEIFEPVNREKADAFLNAAHTDEKFVAAAFSLIELQVPKIEAKEDP